MDKRTEFEDDDDFMEYLLETGSLYLQDTEDGQLYFMDQEKCEYYAPWYYEIAIEAINERLLELLDQGKVQVKYDPLINDKGEVEFNPQFILDDDADLGTID